jgi:hypothetical protein
MEVIQQKERIEFRGRSLKAKRPLQMDSCPFDGGRALPTPYNPSGLAHDNVSPF